MARVRTYDTITEAGLALLRRHGHEVGPDVDDPDAIIVRSTDLHALELNPNLKTIARAGVGYNTIPVDRCTDVGIVVSNTPGANANSVKELVIAAMLLSSRRILEAWAWVRGQGNDDLVSVVESRKHHYAGPEIAGKRLGVIGLGAIGAIVANAGISLGMEVHGYDPFVSVDQAWRLSRAVQRAQSLEALIAGSDYVTLHVPLNDTTRRLLDADLLSRARPGARVLNFARAGLVDEAALRNALATGRIAAYVTDFPGETLHGVAGVIEIPHLGASTPEAESNSAVMAARQIVAFLDHGTVQNAVNFPDCALDRAVGDRVIIANRNVPNMVSQITGTIARAGLNIEDMLNRHRGELAYTIIDVDGTLPQRIVTSLRSIEGVVMARALPREDTP